MRPNRTFRSFPKNVTFFCKECNVLLQRTEKNAKNAMFFCKEYTRERFVLLQSNPSINTSSGNTYPSINTSPRLTYPSTNTSSGHTYPSINTSSGLTYPSINTSSGLTYPSINTYLIRPDSSATNWSVPTPIRTCSKNNRFTCITQFCSDQEPKMKFLGKGQLGRYRYDFDFGSYCWKIISDFI